MTNSRAVVLLVLLLAIPVFSQPFPKDRFSTYSRVKVYVQSSDQLRLMQERGIDIEHYRGKVGEFIEIEINQHELGLLKNISIPYDVLITDVGEHYSNIPIATRDELASNKAILRENGIEGFGYGSMGWFHTYAEVGRQLDTLWMRYPNLITRKDSIGVTEQGRAIWAVEISDNPGVAEPGEGVVYFDALHHAREPVSMSVLLYYMYWLLENYGTNPEATYLVNNRRICFIPVVNPDGYVFNQSTNPNGGGGWRKNRRNNGGSFGVDLNRNYGFMFGYDNIGSSNDPNSETYRGPAAWSEPESRAVRDYVLQRRPAIAFSVHSVAGRYLNPYGFKDTVVSFDYYAEYASDFSRFNNYLYGTVFQMLDYNSNGTTRDYLHHDLNCLTWVPEIGGSGFWPTQSEIVPLCQENLLAVKYLTWVSGGFADYQNFRLVERPFAIAGDTLRFAVTLRNKGLRFAAQNVTVSVQSLNANAVPLFSSVNYDSISVWQSVSNDSTPFLFALSSSLPILTELRFVSTVRQEGIVTSVDTFSIMVGYPRLLFSDDSETGLARWTRSGTGLPWDTTFVMAFDGSKSMADSRYGNVANNSNNNFATSSNIDLSGTANPRLEYFTRWANESGYDYVRIQISTNNGSTWTSLAGRHTTTVASQPGYTANKGAWAWEHINLTPYIGRQVRFRFNLITDSNLRGDGFYFDNFRVVDYRDTTLVGVNQPVEVAERFELMQNYPNPFNPTTIINYQLAISNWITLKAYDVLGREVVTLVNEYKGPGRYRVAWDAGSLASGVYYYRLIAGNLAETKRFVLLK